MRSVHTGLSFGGWSSGAKPSNSVRCRISRATTCLRTAQPLRKPFHHTVGDNNRTMSEASQARAIAVVASLFRYWTGYLIADPAAGPVRGGCAHKSFAPQWLLPRTLLAAWDAPAADCCNDDDALVVARRSALMARYRYASVDPVKLVWSDDAQLPKIEVDGGERQVQEKANPSAPRTTCYKAYCNATSNARMSKEQQSPTTRFSIRRS